MAERLKAERQVSSVPSLMGAQWTLPDPDLNAVSRIIQKHGVPELIARLLNGRAIPEDKIEAFLHPTFKHDFPSPFTLAGMEACAVDVAQAIMAGKRFAIFGDFDVDGATSSSVAYRFLKQCGIEAPIYIPERLTEGYGPNEDALRSLKAAGAEILLMLDCGTGAYETIKAGQAMGLQIVILDHHEAGGQLPPAWHVINPKRKDDTSGLDMLAAVGVTFFFCVAVNAKLREAGFYEGNERAEPDLRQWIDLVALGTVCDIVPLQGVNRLLVRQGFRAMDSLQNCGLRALTHVADIEPPFTPYHAGYILGPRVNAGSRVGKSDLGARLFTLEEADSEEAGTIAWTLNDCNAQRKSMQKEMEDEALALVDQRGLASQPVIVLAKEGWHAGLTGLVAGRLKEHYGKPACVICLEGGVGKGSGRSIAGVHIGAAFIDAMAQGVITKGGGHAMAGGFTVPEEQVEAFSAFVQDHVLAQINGEMPAVTYDIDSLVSVRGALDVQTVKTLQAQVGPFGAGFEEPLFMLKAVRLHSADILGDVHIKLLVSEAEGGPRIKAMAFRAVGTPLGEAFIKNRQSLYDLIGTLKINSWQGRESAELHVKDARISV